MSTTEEKANWVTKLLAGFGVPANWAKVIAGAIIGALAASGLLAQSGCSASIDIMPDGTQRWTGQVEYPKTVTPSK